jgi:hypothetical protein
MTVDMTNNRVPYGLLTDEEKAALHEHWRNGGGFLHTLRGSCWTDVGTPTWNPSGVYRTVPTPKTQDVIAWDRLPAWVEWVARDECGAVWAYGEEPRELCKIWFVEGERRRIDDFPGIVVQIGTCDWKDSKQRRPRG